MAVLEILSIPDPRLKVKAEKVTDVSTVQTLIDDMLETLYATGNGIGLASTQVGRKEAVVVIDISDERNDPLILVNPEVVSGEKQSTWSRRVPICSRILCRCRALHISCCVCIGP